MSGRALLLFLDCSTLHLIRTLYCWVLSKEVSSTIFKVFGMTRPGIEPRSPGPLVNTLLTRQMCPNGAVMVHTVLLVPSWYIVSRWYRYGTYCLVGTVMLHTVSFVPSWYIVSRWYRQGTYCLVGTVMVRSVSLVPLWYILSRWSRYVT